MSTIVHTAVPCGRGADAIEVHVTFNPWKQPSFGPDPQRLVSQALHASSFESAFYLNIAVTAPATRDTVPSIALAGALGALAERQTHQLSRSSLQDVLVFGELRPDGTIGPIRGVLSMLAALDRSRCRTVLLSRDNLAEASLLEGLHLLPVTTLKEAVNVLISHARPPRHADVLLSTSEPISYALDVAASGPHHLLLIGHPGSAASALARAFVQLLPPLTPSEALDITATYSLVQPVIGLIPGRPVRAPHSTVSLPAVSGSLRVPGETVLAHHGVLVLDDVTSFARFALDTIALHLENGFVSIPRQPDTPVHVRASPTVVATMTPCPCGWHIASRSKCRCSPDAIARHRDQLPPKLRALLDIAIVLPTAPPTVASPDDLRRRIARIAAARAARQRTLDQRPTLTRNAAAAVVDIPASTARVAATIAECDNRQHIIREDIDQAVRWRAPLTQLEERR